MARGSSIRDRDRIMTKALRKMNRKKREAKNTLPLLPPGEILIMDSLNPGRRYPAKLLRTGLKNRRTVIVSLECPACCSPMIWDRIWNAFKCTGKTHRKGIYELVG